MSIFQVVTNVHHFPSFQHFKKCEHGPLEVEKPWIAPGSKAMQSLRNCILGRQSKNLDDLEHLTGIDLSLLQNC